MEETLEEERYCAMMKITYTYVTIEIRIYMENSVNLEVLPACHNDKCYGLQSKQKTLFLLRSTSVVVAD
jgi:hypothetical protein